MAVLLILTKISSRAIVGVGTSLNTNGPPYSNNLTAFMRALLKSGAGGARRGDRCFDVREHAELREDHRARGVAIKRLDLAVHDPEDVTAGRVHPLARCRQDPHRRRKGAPVRALQSELHDHDIADAEEPIQLAMHVRKRLRIDLDRLAEAGGAVGPAVSDADRHVGKRPVRREALSPALDIHLLSQAVRRPNDLFVVHGSPSFPSHRKAQISREFVEKEIDAGNPAVPGNDEISPGVSWRLARPALYPLDPSAIA